MSKKPAMPANFESAVEELEKILSQMEDGEVGLEDSLKHYERGTQLLAHCRQILERAEQKIITLQTNTEAKQPPATEPGDDETL
jgi:exodeoxyribonuclease VII small subunit